MCVRYCGGCSVPWGCSVLGGISWVPWGDIMSTVGDILSTMGGVQYRGDILSTVGVFSTVGDIMSTVGVILSAVGDVQYRGGISWCTWGYHEYRGGCSVPWGENLLLFEYPTVLNTPHGNHDIPHMYHDIPPRYSNFKGWYPPMVLKFQRMVSPTVLNIPHGTHDSPHGTHDAPHGTEHPPRYCTHIVQGDNEKARATIAISMATLFQEIIAQQLATWYPSKIHL